MADVIQELENIGKVEVEDGSKPKKPSKELNFADTQKAPLLNFEDADEPIEPSVMHQDGEKPGGASQSIDQDLEALARGRINSSDPALDRSPAAGSVVVPAGEPDKVNFD